MPTFTLNTSTLGGGQFKTQAADTSGEFREIQFRVYQAVGSQDMEPHTIEFHYAWIGLSQEDR